MNTIVESHAKIERDNRFTISSATQAQ